jgi:hypothetical protein
VQPRIEPEHLRRLRIVDADKAEAVAPIGMAVPGWRFVDMR